MNSTSAFTRTVPLLWLVTLALAVGTDDLVAQDHPDEELCQDAQRFLEDDRNMVTMIVPDTIQDWRTQQEAAGCSVTAAGITTLGDMDAEATRFYQRLGAAGWTRTPDPRDAPDEASLRFRMNEIDCLFNFYSAGHLGTPQDLEVSTEVVPGPGEDRYNIWVMCKPAMDAAPRPGGLEPESFSGKR